MAIEVLPFQKKELVIKVHNPNKLPTIDFHQLTELQGDLKISTAKKIEGGWLVVTVDDEVVQDVNFPDGIHASKLAESERLVYSLTRHCFGYGDDARDWDNDGDEWIEFEEMDADKNGMCILYFTVGYFPHSWTWPSGEVEGVVAKIADGHIIDVFCLSDKEWRDAGDLGEVPEDAIIFASFREALTDASE